MELGEKPKTPQDWLEIYKQSRKNIIADINDYKRRSRECRKEAEQTTDEEEKAYLIHEAEYLWWCAENMGKHELLEAILHQEYYEAVINGRI